MAAVLEGCTAKEQHSVAFLWAKGVNAKNVYKGMFLVHGGKCFSRKAVHNWVEKFSKSANDARPGRPVEVATEATVQRVEELIRADRRVTIDSAATVVGCSHGLAYCIMHDRLKFQKLCLRWVTRELKDRKNELNGSVLATSLTVFR
jgi:hypothetical protein